MNRVLSLMLSLIFLFGMVACSPKDQPAGTASKPGQEDPESKETDDFQAGIPEEYRLKINVPADWNDPLPSSEHAIDFPLFGVGRMVNDEQLINREPVDLPKVIDLFTLEELEAFFGLRVVLKEDSLFSEGTDGVEFRLYKASNKSGSSSDGVVEIWIKDYGDPLSASSSISAIASNPREIEDLGRRALISGLGKVYIQMTDTAVLSVSVEIRPPDGGPLEPAEDELLLDFARFVYERVMEKMEKTSLLLY